MRKLVLLLSLLALILFYSIFSERPIVGNFSSNEMLENFKDFYVPSNKAIHSDFNHDLDSHIKVESQSALLDEELEGEVIMQNKNESKEAVKNTLEADLVFEEKPKKLLDLSLPQGFERTIDTNIFNPEYDRTLPDLFAPVVIEEEEDRMSFGGRVLMDEKFDDIELEQYRFQNIRGSIEGVEITFEIKTN